MSSAPPISTTPGVAATLAAELWSATHGAVYLRTHDVRALRDALRVQAAIAQDPSPPAST
jgi:dihydropteroate synthase